MTQEEKYSNAYTPEQMKKFVQAYCAHIADGFSKESFPDCSWRTIEAHISKNPELFSTEIMEIEKAFRLCRFKWEGIGQKIATTGDGNAVSWIFNMKNRFSDEWKDKRETELSGELQVNQITGMVVK